MGIPPQSNLLGVQITLLSPPAAQGPRRIPSKGFGLVSISISGDFLRRLTLQVYASVTMEIMQFGGLVKGNTGTDQICQLTPPRIQ